MSATPIIAVSAAHEMMSIEPRPEVPGVVDAASPLTKQQGWAAQALGICSVPSGVLALGKEAQKELFAALATPYSSHAGPGDESLVASSASWSISAATHSRSPAHSRRHSTIPVGTRAAARAGWICATFGPVSSTSEMQPSHAQWQCCATNRTSACSCACAPDGALLVAMARRKAKWRMTDVSWQGTEHRPEDPIDSHSQEDIMGDGDQDKTFFF
eukprot:scaffold1957_cov110-Isochrysis_galbana.AAC.1